MTEIKDVKVYDLEECIIASGYAMRLDKYNYPDEKTDNLNKHINRCKKLVKASLNILKLILDIERNGNMHGIGKPEPLQYDLQGYFSRRIDDQNRLVYVVDDAGLNIISCRYHYE